MLKSVGTCAAFALALLTMAVRPARADFSACAAGLEASDPHQKIGFYTTCLKHGGVPATDISSAFNNRAVAYEQIGQIDNALQDFNSAIQYDPNWPNAYIGRAGIESGRGLCTAAVADIEKALKLGQKRWPLLNQAAWMLATCADPTARDGRKSIALAQDALKIKDEGAIHDTLAAAYAETGQFDQAQAEEAKAIQAAHEQPGRLDAMQARLELYRHNLPFHTGALPASPAKSGP